MAAPNMPNQPDVLDLLTRVNGFYETAWNHLLIYITILIGIVGVLIPLFIQWYQKKLFKVEEDSIKKELNTHVNDIKLKLNSDIEEKFKGESAKIQELMKSEVKKLEKSLANTTGGVFFVQARKNLDNKYYALAVVSYADAALSLLEGGDQLNLQRALNSIIENCLPNIKKSDIEEYEDVSNRLDELTKHLREKNNGGCYTDFISNIEKGIKEAKGRQ